AVGCGNFHPATDGQYVSTSNRRVELLFFQAGDEPAMDCHAGGCRPDVCQIYDQAKYKQLHVPVMPSPLPWVARFDRETVKDEETAQLLLSAPGLPPGQAMTFEVFRDGSDPVGEVAATSTADAAQVSFGDWRGTKDERRFS